MYAANKSANNNIGPSSYPPMTALGKQSLSSRHNAITYKFLEGPKFGRAAKTTSPSKRRRIKA